MLLLNVFILSNESQTIALYFRFGSVPLEILCLVIPRFEYV